MLKSPELKPEKEKSELAVINSIQMELVRRSKINEIEWIKTNSPEFREFFNSNKDQFTKLYKEDPNELYALLEMVLRKKN